MGRYKKDSSVQRLTLCFVRPDRCELVFLAFTSCCTGNTSYTDLPASPGTCGYCHEVGESGLERSFLILALLIS